MSNFISIFREYNPFHAKGTWWKHIAIKACTVNWSTNLNCENILHKYIRSFKKCNCGMQKFCCHISNLYGGNPNGNFNSVCLKTTISIACMLTMTKIDAWTGDSIQNWTFNARNSKHLFSMKTHRELSNTINTIVETLYGKIYQSIVSVQKRRNQHSLGGGCKSGDGELWPYSLWQNPPIYNKIYGAQFCLECYNNNTNFI